MNYLYFAKNFTFLSYQYMAIDFKVDKCLFYASYMNNNVYLSNLNKASKDFTKLLLT